MPDKLLHGEDGEIRRRKRKSHAFLCSSEKQTGSAEQKGLRAGSAGDRTGGRSWERHVYCALMG